MEKAIDSLLLNLFSPYQPYRGIDMKALFEVGEEVIIESKEAPQLNGDAVVTFAGKGKWINRYGECVYEGYTYETTTKSPDDSLWRETALKKKYKPADEYFSTWLESQLTETVCTHHQ